MNLIFVPVGDKSFHENWINKVEADVCLSYYGTNNYRYQGSSKYYLKTTPERTERFTEAVEKLNIDLKQYKYIWLPDDDILIHPEDVNNLFRYVEKNKIDVAQPSLLRCGFWAHQITLKKNNSGHRLVNFIEAMAPCFHIDSLIEVYKYFPDSLSSFGHGLDYLYSYKLLEKNKKLAVIDEISMIHTKPAGMSYSVQIAAQNSQKLLQKYGAHEYPIREI